MKQVECIGSSEEEYETARHTSRATLIIFGTLPNLNDYTRACRANRYAGADMKRVVEDRISGEILSQLKGVHFAGKVDIRFQWHEPNKRRDLDNICFAKKFILDALVSSGTIRGDGWKVVTGFSDEFFTDNENPRIVVNIKGVGEYDD